jgi:hypothetical protein
MPTDYQCEDCNLAVQVGWYHFHHSDSGYWAATLGFCQKCGTIHQQQHPSDDTLPERIIAQPGPLEIAESEWKAIAYRIPLQDWMAVSESQSCGHCGAQGEVRFVGARETPVVEVCPRCRSTRIKRLYSWIT